MLQLMYQYWYFNINENPCFFRLQRRNYSILDIELRMGRLDLIGLSYMIRAMRKLGEESDKPRVVMCGSEEAG